MQIAFHGPMHGDLGERLRALIGADAVLTDESSLAFYSNDVFWQPGVAPLAITLPRSADDVVALARLAQDLDVALIPRGGGLSYGKGYLPPHRHCIVVDTRRMSRVIEIDEKSRFVTVEAGCTWAELHEALLPTGLRTPYWGPMSGIGGTVGGALSQNSAFYGSSRHGTAADSVLGVTAVLADGTCVTTGSGGRRGAKPFTRHGGGPDFTGLFLGDNGAFGIKVAATLRLIERTPHVGYLSAGFATMQAMVDAQVRLAQTGKIAESFGIDRNKALQSAAVNRSADSVKSLLAVIGAGKSLAVGMKDAVTVAAAGTQFLTAHPYTLHLMVEDESARRLDEALAEVRGIVLREGVELPDSVPRVIRAKPFGPVRGMLGLNGERWVPCHATFALGDALYVCDAMARHFEGFDALMAQHGISRSHFLMCIGNEFFFETAFYWRDELTPLHVAMVGADVTAPWADRPAAPDARAAVQAIRDATYLAYAELGGASWQVSRDYPFERVLEPGSWNLMRRVKASLDPDRRVNPGALGDGC
ncbi:FAD-binding oxidoreductase [Burkholderia sp. Z1]|uniref:FAD-binding oxidoreductase n=1 Tax=Burkholderia sp. Z1 TaxID=2759039 RepID=UPI001D031525|nr:FAD-binding oxidoreductase [Burkholderia sp. Z1]